MLRPEKGRQINAGMTVKQIRGVPKIVMNDTVELVGAQPEAEFVDALLRAAA